MIIYSIAILFFGCVWISALVYLVKEANKKRLAKNNEYMVLKDPDTVVDHLIEKLSNFDRQKEESESYEKNKQDIIDTFIRLHDSKVFCQNLSKQEVLDFINQKLYKEK